jgi:hypothetical protein
MPTDLAVPMAFPDFKAHSDELDANIPSGHAGIMIVNSTGTTAYFEYGRYDPPVNRGLVRKQTVPNATKGAGITVKALKPAFRHLSQVSGHGGRLRAAWIELPVGAFGKMKTYAEQMLGKNSDADRTPYDIADNNCCTFARNVAAAGGAEVGLSSGVLPLILQGTIFPHVAELFGSLAMTMSSPIPNAFIEQLQMSFPGLQFRPKDQWTSEGSGDLEV